MLLNSTPTPNPPNIIATLHMDEEETSLKDSILAQDCRYETIYQCYVISDLAGTFTSLPGSQSTSADS